MFCEGVCEGESFVCEGESFVYESNPTEILIPKSYFINPEVSYLHLNYLGSPVIVTNEKSEVIHKLKYDTWGNLMYTTSSIDASKTKFGFTGHRYDTDSELTYARARYLSTKNQVFMSQDPEFWEGFTNDRFLLNPQSQNSYSYAINNPVNMVDPDGRIVESIWDVAAFGLSVNEFKNNPSILNGLGVGLDGLALAVPVVPAIGGMTIRSASLINKSTDAGKVIDKVGGKSDEMLKFYHGTTNTYADNIIKNKLKPLSTNVGNYEQGSFFTHAGSEGKDALNMAKDWGTFRSGSSKDAAIIEMHIPKNIFNNLRAHLPIT